MYRISYTQGNGYRCNCCRREYDYTLDVQTEGEVLEFLEELEACRKLSVYEDDDDRCVDSIEKEIGINILNQFKPRPEMVAEIIAERQKKKDDEAERLKEASRQFEYKKYLKLKTKFEKP